MSLLPSKPDAPDGEDAEPRVVGVESDDADGLLGALSSETARRMLIELHEDPAPPGELADRVDTSLQNVQYHLENLTEAGVVEVVDTAYSEKGREMDVYAPADRPLVIFAGTRESKTSVRSALSRLLGAVGVLAVVSLLVQELLDGGIGRVLPGGGDSGAGPGAGAATTRTVSPTPQPARTPTAAGGTPDLARTTVETSAGGGLDAATAGVPPGLVFFLGGATVLLVGFIAWYVVR